jgi:hypothetical protein
MQTADRFPLHGRLPGAAAATRRPILFPSFLTIRGKIRHNATNAG